ERGHSLAQDRDLEALRARFGSRAREAFSHHADAAVTREDVRDWDFDAIPEATRARDGMTAYPALVDLGEVVALRVFEGADEATAAHRAGGRVQARAQAVAAENEARGGVHTARPRGRLAAGHRGRRVRRCAARARFECARSRDMECIVRCRVARAVQCGHGTPETGRADPRRAGGTAAVDEARDQGAGASELRRPARPARSPARDGFPARTAACAPRAPATLFEGHAPARRKAAQRPRPRSFTDAAGAAVLARGAGCTRVRRRFRSAGYPALAGRGMARLRLRAGAQDRRAGVRQADGAGAECD